MNMYFNCISAQTGSVYFTVAVTVERFIAVCHPLKARSICTWSRAKYYTIVVVLMSVAYNAPRWAEFYTVTDRDGNRTNLLMTPLRCDETYIRIYIQWANFIVMSAFPIAALVVLNIIIYAEVSSSKISFPIGLCHLDNVQPLQ